jgi:hypothetical protein
MPWQGWWFALTKAEVIGRFGPELRKKFLFLPSLEPPTVTPAGVTNLLGGTIVEFVVYLP